MLQSNCHPVFDIKEFRASCEQIFHQVEERYDFTISEMGFDRNHVHLTIRYKHTLSIEKIAKVLKGTSGYWLLKMFPGIKQEYFWGSGLWSGVIYADSLGQNPNKIYRYVKNQGLESQKNQLSLREFMNAGSL